MTGTSAPAPTAAIVVPNYNHARYLRDSLGSIAAQTRPPDEVIVIDDASTDNSVEVIETMLAGRPSWRLIRNTERRGVIARLNDGLAEAKSDWVLFLGADDGLSPEFVELVLAQARSHPSAGLISACATVVYDSGRKLMRPSILPVTSSGYVSAEQYRRLLAVSDNYFHGTVTLYRRTALATLGGFDPALVSLTDSFAARRLAARHGFGFIPEVLGFWRRHGSNLSVSVVNDREAIERLIERAKSVLAAEPPGLFPANYAGNFARRLRFGAARLLIIDRDMPPGERAAAIGDLLDAGSAERSFLRTALKLGAVGRFGALAWTSLRLRPFSLFRLGLEPLRRLFFVNRNKVSRTRGAGESLTVSRHNA